MLHLSFRAPESRINAISYVSELVARGGPTETEFPLLDEIMGTLPSWPPHQVDQLRLAFAEALNTSETMQGFAYTKPHGYPGDFEIIDRIYLERITPESRLAPWDHYFHAQPAARAVRNRKRYFHELLDRHHARKAPLRVLNLASGPGRCMIEWLLSRKDAAVSFVCVELDATAIAHARSLAQDVSDHIVFENQNILRFAPKERFDLIWAAGICDYFSRPVFERMLRRFVAALLPDGELVAGNFSPINPTRSYMEILGDWRLHHRTASELLEIANAAGAAPEAVSVDAEPEEVNLFLHIKAPVADAL